MDGVIARLLVNKGFGFIRQMGHGHEYFFHRDDCAPDVEFDNLAEGDSVVFDEITPRPVKGMRATNVRLG